MKLDPSSQHVWCRKPLAGFASAALTVALLTALLTPWRDVVEAANIVMLYLLVVVSMALIFTRAVAIFSAGLGVLAFDFFFVSPRFSFSVNDVQYLLTFAVMLVVGIALAELMANLRKQADSSARQAQQATALYELARELTGVASADQVDECVRAFVQSVLGGQCELWLLSRLGEPVRVMDGSKRIPLEVGAVFANGQTLERDDENRLAYRCLLLPLEAPVRRRGVCVLSLPTASLNDASRQTGRMLASLAAIALERLHYVEVAHAATLEMETEKLRSVILSALSHDIRTPLTVMLGLAETLQQSHALSPEQVRELSGAIHGHATRLNDLAHKLLDMARLQSGVVRLHSEWQSVEEIVGASLAAMGSRLDQARVTLDLPDDLPLVEFDAVLIERVLCNLFDNALRYAGETVALHVSCVLGENSICIFIEDDGPGLPTDFNQWLFQPFQRGAEHGAGGLGLGLAICYAIARAHGGELDATVSASGGACFRLTLPRRDPPGIEPELGEGA